VQDRYSNINSNEIWFKSSSDEKGYEKYTPDQIEGFELNGEFYVSENIPLGSRLKKVFLKPLIIGKLSLFYYQDEYLYIRYDSSKTYSIKLVKDKLSRENRSYRGLLKTLAKDCKSINPDTIKSHLDDLKFFVLKYNYCSGTEAKIFNIKERKSFIEFGILVGYSISSISLNTYRDISDLVFDPTRSLIFGVQTQYTYKEKISYRFEVAFNEVDYLSNRKPNSLSFVKFNSSQLQFAWGVLKPFPRQCSTPFIGVGASYFLPIKFETTYRFGNSFQILEKETFNSQLGFWLSIGIKRKTKLGITPFVEARIENAIGYGVSSSNLSKGANPLYGTIQTGFVF
jgi:hypothetical protein